MESAANKWILIISTVSPLLELHICMIPSNKSYHLNRGSLFERRIIRSTHYFNKLQHRNNNESSGTEPSIRS